MIPNSVEPSGLIARPSIPRFAWRPLVVAEQLLVGSPLGFAIANASGTSIRRIRLPWRLNWAMYGPYSSDT